MAKLRKKVTIMRDQRKFLSIPNVIALLTIFISIGAAWAERVADSAVTKSRLTVVEDRQKEDRVNGNIDRDAIKKSVNETNNNVQLILRKLDSMEAVRAEERAFDRRKP